MQTAIAAIRQRPMLAVAGAGVAAAIVYASRGRAGEEAEAAAAESGASGPMLTGSVQPYALPGGFMPADLATADLANAIREGNAAVVNAIAQRRIAAAPQAPTSPTIPGIPPARIEPRPPLPPSARGPAAPPPTGVRVEPNRPVSRGTLLERARSAIRGGGTATITHVVQRGDTLSGIAGRYGTPGGWQRIYADNRSVVGSNPNLIHPGMRLSVAATRGI